MQPILRIVFVICTLLVVVSSGCGQATSIETDHAKLKGKWEVVAWECNGQKLKEGGQVGCQYEYEDDKYRVIIVPDKIGPWIRYELQIDADLHVLVVYHKTTTMPENTVKDTTSESIYRIDGDELQICSTMILTPKYRHPTSFTSKPKGEILFLKRIPFSNPKEEEARISESEKRKQSAAFYGLQPMVSGRIRDKFNVDFCESAFNDVVKDHWQKLLDLRDIRKLIFRGCTGVGDEEMQYVGKLTSLEALDLNSTDVSDAGILKLLELNNLQSLDLSFTSVSDSGIIKLAGMRNLKELIVTGSLVTSQGITDLQGQRNDLKIVWPRPYTITQQKAVLALSQLRLNIEDDVDPYFEPKLVTCQIIIPPFVKIRDLSRKENNPTTLNKKHSIFHKELDAGLIANYFEQLPSPTAIIVRDDELDDSVFICLKNIQGLVRLNLGASRITDDGIAVLKDKTSLRSVSLSEKARITKTSILILASLPNLEEIDLRGIDLKPDDLEPLLKLEKLKCLAVNRKQLSPEQFAQFRQKGVEILGWK